MTPLPGLPSVIWPGSLRYAATIARRLLKRSSHFAELADANRPTAAEHHKRLVIAPRRTRFDWLTLITEFVGMTAAPAIFLRTAVDYCYRGHSVDGRDRTERPVLDLRKACAALPCVDLVYILGAFLVHPSVRDVLHQGLIPNFAGRFTGRLLFFVMANIGATIAPWMLFF